MNKLGKIIAVAVTFAAVAGLSSFATAHIVNYDQVHVCVNPRTRALQWDGCKSNWKFVKWNRTGPTGRRGPVGPRGPEGQALDINVSPPVQKAFGEDDVGTRFIMKVPCENPTQIPINYEYTLYEGHFLIRDVEWQSPSDQFEQQEGAWRFIVEFIKDTDNSPGASFVAYALCATPGSES